MNVNLYVIEDYRKKDDFLVRINKPNSNPISEKSKMNVNLYIIEDYENETALRPQKKQTQSNPVLSAVEWANFKPDSELLECPREFSLMVRAGQALYCRKRMTEDRRQRTGNRIIGEQEDGEFRI
jgi:hypothetical protein